MHALYLRVGTFALQRYSIIFYRKLIFSIQRLAQKLLNRFEWSFQEWYWKLIEYIWVGGGGQNQYGAILGDEYKIKADLLSNQLWF